MLRLLWRGPRLRLPFSTTPTVMVLGRHGYETAVEGKNGFVCIMERAIDRLVRQPRVLER